MSAGDNLFVPSGGAVSWRAKAGGGVGDDEALAVRFCYVDASNFNSVKSQLPLYAAVEVRLHGMWAVKNHQRTKNHFYGSTDCARLSVPTNPAGQPDNVINISRLNEFSHGA